MSSSPFRPPTLSLCVFAFLFFIGFVNGQIGTSTTRVVLTASATSAMVGRNVTLTASIISFESISVHGNLTFSIADTNTVLKNGLQKLPTNGRGVTFVTADLPAGTLSISVRYSGDVVNAPSTSLPVTIVVTPESVDREPIIIDTTKNAVALTDQPEQQPTGEVRIEMMLRFPSSVGITSKSASFFLTLTRDIALAFGVESERLSLLTVEFPTSSTTGVSSVRLIQQILAPLNLTSSSSTISAFNLGTNLKTQSVDTTSSLHVTVGIHGGTMEKLSTSDPAIVVLPQPTYRKSRGSHSISDGGIVGIVVGLIAGIAALSTVICCIVYTKRGVDAVGGGASIDQPKRLLKRRETDEDSCNLEDRNELGGRPNIAIHDEQNRV